MSTPEHAHSTSFSDPILSPYQRGLIHGLTAGALLMSVLILPVATMRDIADEERRAITEKRAELDQTAQLVAEEETTEGDSGKEEEGGKIPEFFDDDGV